MTEYIKTALEKLATDLDQEPSSIERQYANAGRERYPSMLGAMEVVVRFAAGNARGILRLMDAEAVSIARLERIETALENIGINLGDDALATLELIARDNTYRDERRRLSSRFDTIIREVQESEREYEYDNANDALLAAGFVYDEDADKFRRGDTVVEVTLINGKESRCSWTYQQNGHAPDSGVSGEFSRLLALIAVPRTGEQPASEAAIAKEAIQ